MNIETVDGERFTIRYIKNYLYVDSDYVYPHWGWLVFWAVVFFPCMLGWPLFRRKVFNVVIIERDSCERFPARLLRSDFNRLSRMVERVL